MKVPRKEIILTAALIFSFVCSLAQQTKILTAEKHNEYGIVYSLPSTALKIRVTATKETRKAGPYYKYAQKYAGTDKVVKQDEVVWTIKSVNILPYGIPNDDQRYLMQLKAGAITFVAVDADGMLLAINAKPDETVEEQTAVAIADDKIKLSDNEYLQYVNEDFISAQSSAKQAQMLSEELMEIRDAKISLTRGTADAMPTDGRQLEIMLNSLARQEAALMAAFTGETNSETVVREFNYLPKQNGREILFRFSDFAGFVEADNYAGEPVYIDIKVTEEATMPVDSKGETKKLPKDAVMYALPGSALTTVSFKGSTLESIETEMAQFGTVFGLNPSIFTDKKEPSYAIFDPATGALLELGTQKD